MKFETKSLNQCLLLVIDRRGVTPKKLGSDWTDAGYRVLSANNVKSSGLQKTDEIRYVNKTTYQKWMHTEIQRDDILLTSEAPAGEVYVWDSDEKIVVGQRLYALRVKEDVNPWFLAFYLQSPKGKAEIKNKCSGSTVFGISAKTFDSIEIVLPDKTIQDHIADVLHNINSKIEINNALSSKLEDFTRMVYDYWFLQFEFPNEEGKPYKSSGGKMVWNEELKREIPEGWEGIHLSDIATIKTDGINPMDNPTLEYIHYSIPAFDETHFPVKELGESINSGKYIVPENAILVSKLNPQFKRIWDPVECGDNCICSTEFMPFVPKDKYRGYLYSVLNSDPFQQYMIACSSSSTGSRKRMQPELCGSFPFASPQNEDPIIAKMSSLISGILMMNRKIVIETQQLTSLRDFLLPLLMNGQVTFKDHVASEEE